MEGAAGRSGSAAPVVRVSSPTRQHKLWSVGRRPRTWQLRSPRRPLGPLATTFHTTGTSRLWPSAVLGALSFSPCPLDVLVQ